MPGADQVTLVALRASEKGAHLLTPSMGLRKEFKLLSLSIQCLPIA